MRDLLIILFVCSGNVRRSPRAAEVFSKLARNKGVEVNVLSAGTDPWEWVNREPERAFRQLGVRSTTQVTHEMLELADKIVVMDEGNASCLVDEYGVCRESLDVLDIPDKFTPERGNFPELYKKLVRKLTPILDSL